MPLLVHAMVRPLARYREAVELTREADGEVSEVDHLLHFAEAFGENLAGFESYQGAELGLMRAELVADLAHDLAPGGRGDQAPARERFSGLTDDAIIVG